MNDFWLQLTMGSFDDFPSSNDLVRGHWAPLYFEPIPGSGERLTIATVVINESGFEVVPASRLSAFGCLYPSDVERLQFFARSAIEAVKIDVSKRRMDVIAQPSSPMSGVYFGKFRESLGESLEAIGKSWLQRTSSLVFRNEDQEDAHQPVEIEMVAASAPRRREPDKLPVIIYDGIIQTEPSLSINFHPDIRAGRSRTGRRRGASVSVDYEGKHIVATFCTLKAVNAFQASRVIKPYLWDLAMHRDSSRANSNISHELLVQRPAPYDTQFTEKQHRNVATAIADLEYQAKRREIILKPFTSPKEMIDRLIEAEAA